jgi:hypothetical protein
VRLSSALAIAVGVAVLAGCGDGPPSSSPVPESPSPVKAEHYRCDRVAFLPGLLLQAGAAERDADGAAEALRTFMSGPLNDGFMPATGWRRLGRAAEFTEFANDAREPGNDGFVSITFKLDGTRWNAFRWGGCLPRRVVLGDLESLAWWLPAGAPDSTAQTLSVNIVVDECNAGPAADSILPPLFELSDRQATIILTGRRLGRRDCPAGVPTSWTIDLPEELGDRVLLDGSEFPGRDATTEPLGLWGTGG